jgi:ABC-2 type transport system ATP-binding protein
MSPQASSFPRNGVRVTLAAGIDAIELERSKLPRHRDPSQRSTSVSVRRLTKSFAVRRSWRDSLRHPISGPMTLVIDALDLDVFEGEMFGVLGLNGAGKTTLLKILATLILPDAGTATVAGFDLVAEPQAARANLAIVTADERSLNWRLSGIENVLLFAGLHRMKGNEARRRSARVLATVNLQSAGNKIVGAFSSGMRQRLLLARALLSDPKILLLDEPTRSLDPVAAHDFRCLLRELADQRGVTVILATHNPEEAFTYCDRVAVIHRGTIAALGKVRDLAMRFGPERYRIWTANTEHPSFNALLRRGLVQELTRPDDADDGQSIECRIPGGDAQPAEVLRRLIESHVAVTRFERVAVPLPVLIARIVEAHAAAGKRRPTDA